MSSQLFDLMGIGNLDIAYLFIGVIVLFIILFVIVIVQINKIGKLRKTYEKFMLGKNAESLENEITSLFEDIIYLKESADTSRKEISRLYKKQEKTYQKIGLVKYDAFKQMGGKLSFSLALLDEKDNGFLLNSVHSTDGCYSYVKGIKAGECSIALGDEEKKALEEAINGKKRLTTSKEGK